MDLDAVLLRAVGLGASDVHLKVGQPPVVRKDGELVHVTELEALGDADLEAVLHRFLQPAARRQRPARRRQAARPQAPSTTGVRSAAFSRPTTRR